MLLFLALSPALAAGSGLQARLYDGAFDIVRANVEGETFGYEADEIGAEYDCWDWIGVQDLSIDIPVEQVELAADDGALSLWVQFGHIYGEDWTVVATDEDWLDTCPEFESTVYYVSLEGAVLTARVVPDIDDGAVVFRAEDVEIQGELDTDIDDFPDDLVLEFFEETILETIAEQGAALMEEQLSGYLDETLLSGTLADYSLSLAPEDIEVSREAVELGATARVSWTGDDGCAPVEQPENEGRTPALDFDGHGDTDLGLGLTEGMVTELVAGLWADGWFCFTEDNFTEFLALVADAFDPGVGGLAATAELSEAPGVTVDESGITLSISDLHVAITGEQDGEAVDLLDTTLSLTGKLELGVDASVGNFTLSLRDLELDVESFDAEHLVSGDDAGDHLAAFVETWVSDWLEASAQDLVLFSTLYEVYGVVVRIDDLELQPGGVVLFVDLYDEDDEAVDTVPPETQVAVSKTADGAKLSWSGADDRAGALAYAWRLDGGTWSSWTTDTGTTIEDLEPGEYNVEVTSRDAWWNTDATPASANFEVDGTAAPVEEEARRCGCGSGLRAWMWLALPGLLALRRRKM